MTTIYNRLPKDIQNIINRKYHELMFSNVMNEYKRITDRKLRIIQIRDNNNNAQVPAHYYSYIYNKFVIVKIDGGYEYGYKYWKIDNDEHIYNDKPFCKLAALKKEVKAGHTRYCQGSFTGNRFACLHSVYVTKDTTLTKKDIFIKYKIPRSDYIKYCRMNNTTPDNDYPINDEYTDEERRKIHNNVIYGGMRVLLQKDILSEDVYSDGDYDYDTESDTDESDTDE